MSYVQIRYSGFNLSPDSELQGLTPSGVGSATQFDHIQMHNSSDDGMEVFGGRPNFKHMIVTGAEDDSFDTDVGMRVEAGQPLVELDSNDAQVAYDQAVANLAGTVRQVRGLYTSVDAGQAIRKSTRVAVAQARADVERREGLGSEERRVGKGGVSTCRSRCSPYH